MPKAIFLLTLLVSLFVGSISAWAATYMDLTVSDSDQGYAVRKVWDVMGLRWIGVMGDVEFTIGIIETNPEDIDTCWIYLDGITYTGTSIDFVADDYRDYSGCAVIKYEDESYESLEFRIQPAWDPESQVATGAQPPTSYSLPDDETAASIIYSVASTDASGPPEGEFYCACKNEGCHSLITTSSNCRSNSDPNNCWADIDCMDKW